MTLTQRLSDATEGTRGLDCEVACALGWTVHNARRNGLWVVPFGDYDTCDPDAMFRLGDYTTSLDAALALAERILPGWCWEIRTDETGCQVQGAPSWWFEGLAAPDQGGVMVDTKTAPLALCLAILKAKASNTGVGG